MAPRLDLQALLLALVPNVYFQPPATVQMVYPCIVYNLDDIATDYADDLPYHHRKRYEVKVIDRNPDSTIPDMVGQIETSRFDRFYTADNLNHYVYKLFF